MLNKIYNWIMIILVFNPFMVYSVNSFMSLWINMELNLILFIIYIIMNNNNDKIMDLPMKYFIINSFSSILFLMMIFIYLNNKNNIYIIIMNIFMFIKLGMFPFHYWFINMMVKLSWMSCFFLSIWQKLIPLLIIFYLNYYNLLMLYILINGLFSVVMSINEMNLKKIMGYSSINHMGWMLVSLIHSIFLFKIYYYIYLILSLFLMKNFENYKYNYLLDFKNFENKKLKFLMIMFILSLGGLPPFLGFLMKMMVIIEMIFMKMYLEILLLIFYSLIYLYYYIQMINNFMMMNFQIMKFFMTLKSNYMLNMFFKFILILTFFSFYYLLIISSFK